MTRHPQADLPTAPHPPPVPRTSITAELGPGYVIADRDADNKAAFDAYEAARHADPGSADVLLLLRSLNGLLLVALVCVTVGCGSDEGPSHNETPDAGPAPCAPGEMPLEDGRCQPAGLPPEMPPCPPGAMPLDGGGCQPAGVPPDACGQGFEPDGQAGCNPILPDRPCPRGQMAVPGDTRCHEVAPCGDGDYGTIPVESTTQFVNGAYSGSDSDGTQEKPWKLIQEGIDHAGSGAIVAVAAGSYLEDVSIEGSPVQVWGRCPALVEVVGTGAAVATLQILHDQGSHSEAHSLAITGPTRGIGMSGASDVVIDSVWIHDTMDLGFYVDGLFGPTSVTMGASLIEKAKDLGVLVLGANATIESTVVRDTEQRSDATSGRGVELQDSLTTKKRATLTLRTSLIEQNREIGVSVSGSDATIESTVVRATRPRSDGSSGDGLVIQNDYRDQERSTLVLRGSLLEQNHDAGVLVYNSDATIESTVVRATQPRSDGTFGRAIAVDNDPEKGERATLTLRTSLLEQNHTAGVFVIGSDATIESTVVRATQQRRNGTGGFGIEIQDDFATNERATLVLRGSLLEQNHDVGVWVGGSDATIESTIVSTTQPRLDGEGGLGIGIQDDPETHARSTLTLRGSLLEQNHDAGVLVQGSDATIEATIVRATQPLDDGTFGTGLGIQYNVDTDERSTLTLRSSLVEQNHDVGVLIIGSDATIEATLIRSTQPRGDATFGDGISVLSDGDSPATAAITSSKVESNARAGISAFGSSILLVLSAVQCNRLNLDGEEDAQSAPFTFDGSNGNLCGCEDLCGCDTPDPTCPVLSASLTPPDPLPPIQPER